MNLEENSDLDKEEDLRLLRLIMALNKVWVLHTHSGAGALQR